MSLTVEQTKTFFAAVLGRECNEDGVIDTLQAYFSSPEELVAHLIITPEFLGKTFYGKVPSFLLSRDKYLFQGVDDKRRCEYFFYHHNYLCRNLSDCSYLELIRNGLILYECCPRNIIYQVSIGENGFFSFEGELTVSLRANGFPIFAISFNFVPGLILGKASRTAILISRIQGHPGKFEEIRKATKELNEISPPHFLYSALMGIAQTFGIDVIGGVCGAKHCSHSPENDDQLRVIYDDFFESIGAERTVEGFFVTSVSDQLYGDRVVTSGNRSRTRRKRRNKAAIARSVQVLSSVTLSPTKRSHPGHC